MTPILIQYSVLGLLIIGEILFIFGLAKTLSRESITAKESTNLDKLLTFGMLSGGAFISGCIFAAFRPLPILLGLLGGVLFLQWLGIFWGRRLTK